MRTVYEKTRSTKLHSTMSGATRFCNVVFVNRLVNVRFMLTHSHSTLSYPRERLHGKYHLLLGAMLR